MAVTFKLYIGYLFSLDSSYMSKSEFHPVKTVLLIGLSFKKCHLLSARQLQF